MEHLYFDISAIECRVNLVYPEVSFQLRMNYRAMIVFRSCRYIPRKLLWFETERLAERCIHSAMSSRAMCNDIAFTDRRGRGGITITCRKLFTNTRPKPKAHTHGKEGVGRDRARWKDGYRGLRCTGNNSGWWVPVVGSNCNKLTALITPRLD